MQRYKLPKGFFANGIHCGIKQRKKDLSLFFSQADCKIAALFTKNIVKAAPVILAEKQLKRNKSFRGIIVNSGNANCMTGKRGIKDAQDMIAITAKYLAVSNQSILVSSTGIIGKYMPMEIIKNKIGELVKGLSKNGFVAASEGIMTTDRFCKVSSHTFNIGARKVTITGVAKGAGMVNPDMATVLCFVFTDANISNKALDKALRAASSVSFNSIMVDGDMSTNDTIMLLANGASRNRLIREDGKDFERFQRELEAILKKLAKMIVRDGEGASKFIEVKVKGAQDESSAKKMAQAIGNSLLVKCACLGGDPNWGRIASSAGASGVIFDPNKMEIILDDVTFFKNNRAVSVAASKRAPVFKNKNVNIEVDLHAGKHEAIVYSCDITKSYIAFNAHYST